AIGPCHLPSPLGTAMFSNHRIITLACASLLMLSLSQRARSQSAGIGAVWANDGGDKVAQGELRATRNLPGVLNSVWDGHQVSVFGARNEVVDYNLVLEAPSGAGNVSVTFSALSGPGGATISSVPASGDQVFNWT